MIPLFNKEASIKRALLSVLTQAFSDFEVIVVDDESTDGGPQIVSRHQDQRIRLIRQKHGGVSAARNRGVAESQSDRIAFLDADDEWEKTFLNSIFDLVKRYPGAGLYSTAYKIVDRNGAHIVRCGAEFRDETHPEVVRHFFRAAWSGPFPTHTSSICVDKNTFNAVGGFPIGIRSGQDQAVWARIALAYQVVASSRCEATYHHVGTENSTRFRYFGLKHHFDFLSLLEGCTSIQYFDDLERWVEKKMYEIAMLALIHGNDRQAAKEILQRVTSRHWKRRRTEVRILFHLPSGIRRSLFRSYQYFKTQRVVHGPVEGSACKVTR